MHFCDFFRTFVDQKHNHDGVWVVGRNRLRDRLKHQGLTCFWRRNDKRSLSFANGCDQIDDSTRQILSAAIAAFEVKTLFRKERRQILKKNLMLLGIGLGKINFVNFEESEVSFAIFRRPYLSRNTIAGTQIKTPNLAVRNVDVVGTCQIACIVGAEKTEAIG